MTSRRPSSFSRPTTPDSSPVRRCRSPVASPWCEEALRLRRGLAGALDLPRRPEDRIDARREVQERCGLGQPQPERLAQRVLLDDGLGRLDRPRCVMDLRAQQGPVGAAIEAVALDEPSREALASRQSPTFGRAVARAEPCRRNARVIATAAESYPSRARFRFARREEIREAKPRARAEHGPD